MNQTMLRYREKIGNLHIYMDGSFDSETALRSATCICRYYGGKGNIFMHMRNVSEIGSNAKHMFALLVDVYQLPRKRIYFTGEKGFLVCHNGGRVIISKRERLLLETENRLP